MEYPTQDVETFAVIDLKHLLGLFRRWAWLLLLAVLLGMAAAYLISGLQAPVYQAKTSVMITRSSSEGPVTDITQALSSQQIAQTYVELLSQRWVLDSVTARVGGKIDGDQIKALVATNTQIIDITVEDSEPSRASRIADTLVQVLIEQNENIQSERYVNAEKSLDAQVQKVKEQIADVQTQLERARSDALAGQIATAKENIESTRTAIAVVQAEIANLSGLSAAQAKTMLAADNKRLEKLQAKSAGEITREEKQEIQSLQSRIAWLTPLVNEGMVARTLSAKQEELSTQQALLLAYQQTYVNLLASGKVEGTTDKIAGLELNLNLYQETYLNLLNDYESVRLLRMQNMPNVVQLNPAVVSSKPVGPHVLINTLAGGLALLILVVSVLLVRDFFEDTVKSDDQVNERLKLPVVGYIPEMPRRPKNAYVFEHPHSPAAEAFRTLRTNLEFLYVDGPVKLLLVASPDGRDEKTGVAVNLAISLAQGGKRVLLIDADLRHPQVHCYLELPNDKGLSDLLCSSAPMEQVTSAWRIENLAVITSGDLPSNPADSLASERMTTILKSAREQADIVVMEAPSFLVADASILSAKVDGVLLVLEPGRTPLASALFAAEQVKRTGTHILGVVLNRIPRESFHFLHGYGSQ